MLYFKHHAFCASDRSKTTPTLTRTGADWEILLCFLFFLAVGGPFLQRILFESACEGTQGCRVFFSISIHLSFSFIPFSFFSKRAAPRRRHLVRDNSACIKHHDARITFYLPSFSSRARQSTFTAIVRFAPAGKVAIDMANEIKNLPFPAVHFTSFFQIGAPGSFLRIVEAGPHCGPKKQQLL